MSMIDARCPVCLEGILKMYVEGGSDSALKCNALDANGKSNGCTAIVSDKWADGFWTGHQTAKQIRAKRKRPDIGKDIQIKELKEIIKRSHKVINCNPIQSTTEGARYHEAIQLLKDIRKVVHIKD